MRRFFGHRKLVCKREILWLSILRHLPRPSVTSVQGLEANTPNQGYREEESIKELMRIKPYTLLMTLTLIVVD